MDITMIAIAGLISLIVGTVFGISVRRLQTFRSKVAARSEAEPVKNYIQKLPHPDPATFLGKGKMNEIKDFVKEEN